MRWYMQVKTASDARARLENFTDEAAALAEKARILAEDDPEAEIEDPFEESDDYGNSWPRVQGRRVASPDGTEVDFWTDGVTTPRS